jgi:hypothetical protein
VTCSTTAELTGTLCFIIHMFTDRQVPDRTLTSKG